MPDDAEKQEKLDLATPVEAELLPPVVPPSTKTPFTFNQQVNIQNIPSKAWDKLSPEQIVDLSKTIIEQVDKIDRRHFDWAMDCAVRSEKTHKMAMSIGGGIAIVGILAVGYLSLEGHQLVAGMMGTFLATIIAVALGNRFFRQ
jgi:hypothetical protein